MTDNQNKSALTGERTLSAESQERAAKIVEMRAKQLRIIAAAHRRAKLKKERLSHEQ